MYLGNRVGARYVLVGLPDDPGQGPELEAHDGQDNARSKARRVVCHLLGIKKGRDRLCQSVACS